MFDPAILLDLQKAVAPPLTLPPAIEREWVSPMAERGRRMVGAFMDTAEQDSETWRANLAIWASAAEKNRDHPRSLSDLEALDRMVDKVTRQARDLHREADRDLKRRGQFRKRVAEADPSAAKVLWAQTLRMNRLQIANAEAMDRLATALRQHRDAVDTRPPADIQVPRRSTKPNAATIAAMKDVRAGIGLKRAGSVAELMAELHAEED